MTNEKILETITELGKSFEKGIEVINEIKNIVTSSQSKQEAKPQGKKYDAKSLMERITSVEAACDELGVKYQIVIHNAGNSADNIAYEELKVVVQALRKGQGNNGSDWVPDYTNKNKQKWFPVFDQSSGFAFAHAGCEWAYSAANASGGVRLVFPTEELAAFAGKTFLKEYQVFLSDVQ